MGRSYRRYYRRNRYASEQLSKRHTLSRAVGGIDRDIEQIFFKLPSFKLESVFLRYGEEHGAGAVAYARRTYSEWKSGRVSMGGEIAQRLLNLVPGVLDPSTRFDLVKKLRTAHLPKAQKYVSCAPTEWRSQVSPVVADLLTTSRNFQLPPHVLSRVHWLTEGDAVAAQRLLAAAEQDEAVVRLHHLEEEFKRIDFLLQNIEATKSVRHTIELPQGTIEVFIQLPRKSLWQRLGDLIS